MSRPDREGPRRPAFLARLNAAPGGAPEPGNDWQGGRIDTCIDTDIESCIDSCVDTSPASELDCLRGVLAPALLDAAEHRARELNIGADQVLIQSGIIEEAAYLERLAAHLDIATESFATIRRADSPLRDDQIPHAAACGLIPLRRPDGALIWTLAPRRLASRTLCHLVARYPDVRPRTRMTSAASLQQFLQQQGGEALADAATIHLRQAFPILSAAPSKPQPRWRQRLGRGAGIVALLIVPPALLPAAWSTIMALWFLAFSGLRLMVCVWPRAPAVQLPRLPDHQLPVYTVIAALYHEANSVAALIRAIDALDYPREKLDVILVVEPNDLATRAAIARLRPKPHLRVLIAPPDKPQTKPKALNYALAFARGSFIAIFDAEDRPEPGQLHAALSAFRTHGADTACAQASLCVDNISHSWLSRTFAVEYVGQFDMLLPGMSELGLPLPLGGSSNHFRTSVLREVGGWDPFNVTEDADLGLRLARFGYRSVTFASTTFEEAPIAFGNWLRQRSRWMKGWLQTWQVHMRHPRLLWREVGPAGFVTLNVIVGGNVLTALAYPILLGAVLTSLLNIPLTLPSALVPSWSSPLHLASVMTGLLSTVAVGLWGLRRRKQLRRGWIMALTPLYWLCLSIAAWRAVAQYVWAPYQWEKTEHGVARREQTAAPAQSAVATRGQRRARYR
ncbi:MULTISPECIES: glycosyltransferase [Rhodopseudomonas]|uniref:glycosyltransferase family 2 protein n=1 Tax=Rhodopseudomonas TaxID=1073 RepID=UPI0009BAAA16|nr:MULTISPECIES: glycosyltransferase [Rhodopseudomonas]MDF3813650.1 glycosyltransferase [Rhodopseudomonas sp. BAL398]WOK15986.1 glycosyltransferase [Rhodopseudomonas sp. BAL398]